MPGDISMLSNTSSSLWPDLHKGQQERKGAFYLWSSWDRQREALKVLPAGEEISPASGSACPLYPSESAEGWVVIRPAQDVPFSEMPTAFWLVPSTV